jgi:hypothetical protein
LGFGASALEPQEGSEAGAKGEDWSAEMGDPAGEEEEWVGVGEIGGRKGVSRGVKKVAGVIESHDDHDGSAQSVDGLDTRAGSGDRGHLGDSLLREEGVEVKFYSWRSCGASEIEHTFDEEKDA